MATQLDAAPPSRTAIWARALLTTGALQAVVQGFGFVAGIVVVRLLPTAEYAHYTIALAAAGAMAVIADAGISGGAMAYGGRHWLDRTRLGGAIAAAFALRRRFSALVLAAGLPLTAGALLHQGAQPLATLAVCAALVPGFLWTSRGQLLEVPLRLHQRIDDLQRLGVYAAAARVAIAAGVLLVAPVAALAVFVVAPVQYVVNRRLARLAETYAAREAPADPDARRALVAQVRRVLPGAAYYAISGQLGVALIATFGSTASVAAVGALGRLAMILGVLNSVFSLLVVPRFARLAESEPARIGRRYWQAQAFMAALAIVPVALLAAFPTPAVAVLGPAYAGLEHEAVLMAAGAVLSTMAGVAFTLGAARGTIAPAWAIVPGSVALQALLAWQLPVDTVAGVIWMGIVTSVAQWAAHAVYFAWRRRPGAAGTGA